SLTLGVLARLREERYGYTLRQALAADGLEMEESTLYPLLRRLESQGLLVSEWREEEKRKKRFYRLSAQGEIMLQRLLDEWRRISSSLDKIIED
ncbi:MAG TPA: helix-turn-helix transcriptional regulator, partial [Phenylobacterium sp.]|uniref:PadR family transcriptional regulator n=1 Tax=Phenylobacterium sp. TaxID=1871053 RepID=UPI002D54732D